MRWGGRRPSLMPGRTTRRVAGARTISDPKSNVEVQRYTNGKMTSRTRGYGTPQAATWTYKYDMMTLGTTSVRDANNNTTTQAFDDRGSLLDTTDQQGDQTTFAYDRLNDFTSM